MTQATSATPRDPASSTPEADRSLGGRNFFLVCLSHLLGYFSNSLVQPVLPLFLVGQGYGEGFVGLVLGTHNVISFSVRLLVGHLVDAGQRRLTLGASGLFLGVSSLLFLTPLTPLYFLARGISGLGWAGLNVAGAAWAGSLAPVARRAEALGYFTMAQRIGGTAAQVLGLWAVAQLGFPPVFLAAGVMGLVLFAAVQTTRQDQQRAIAADGEPLWRTLLDVRKLFAIETKALLGTGLQTLSVMTAPATTVYMPLYFKAQGIEHVELYFLAIGVTGIAGRAIVGKWADRVGRLPSVATGFAAQLVGLSLLGFSPTFFGMMLAGVIYTFGNVLSEPSLYALALDRAPANRRGAAMATYTSSFQLGSGIGAVAGGFIIERSGYEMMYRFTLVPAVAGLIWLAAYGARSRRSHAAV